MENDPHGRIKQILSSVIFHITYIDKGDSFKKWRDRTWQKHKHEHEHEKGSVRLSWSFTSW